MEFEIYDSNDADCFEIRYEADIGARSLSPRLFQRPSTSAVRSSLIFEWRAWKPA